MRLHIDRKKRKRRIEKAVSLMLILCMVLSISAPRAFAGQVDLDGDAYAQSLTEENITGGAGNSESQSASDGAQDGEGQLAADGMQGSESQPASDGAQGVEGQQPASGGAQGVEVQQPASDGAQGGEDQPVSDETQESEEQKPAAPADTEIEYETTGDFDSVEELAAAPNDRAYCFMRAPMRSLNASREGEPQWSFDAYYVNEADRYQVTRTDDFSLKYQMEFHASDDFEPGDIRIEIDEALFTYREKEGQGEGTKAKPSDIGVPEAKWNEEEGKWEATPSRSTPFNWYVEDGKLVFYNYKKIDAGTNAAWQVLYSNLKIMDITDEASWSMKPVVYIYGTESSKEVSTLTGRVNSSVSLGEVVKAPYYETGKKYTPGLYTLEQLKAYAGNNINSKYIDPTTKKLNTTEYRYVVWDVKIKGNASQPWTMYIQDTPSAGMAQGEIVGYRDNSDRATAYDYEVNGFTSKDGKVQIAASESERSWGHRFQVVTAYPASVLPGDEVQNDLTVTLEPKDKKDPDVVVKAAPASWEYRDYDWKYEGDTIGTEKWNGWGSNGSDKTEYTGWLEAWNRSDKDYGDIPYTVTGSMKGYEFTHEVSGPNLGAYKEGTSYSLTTVDDYLYAVEEDGTTHAMGKDDYYFSSVAVSQTDRGYDIYEDRTDKSERAALVEAGELPADFGKVKIYAMFAKDKSGKDVAQEGTGDKDWELVSDSISMDDNGTAKYSFTQSQIGREPYRVKVEHESVDYSTECTIKLAVRLKKTSETSGVMEELITKHNSDMYHNSPRIRFENLSGVMGTQKRNGSVVTTIYAPAEELNKDTGLAAGVKSETSYNYTDRKGLADKTTALYAGLLVRDNAQRTVSWLETTAKANKKYSSQNDAANNRVLVDYYLTAYDGYLLYDQGCLDYMSRLGIDKRLMSPGRKQVVFYDLLPYGMQFDASTPVKAGRIRELDSRGNYMESPNDWDRTQVSVTVDPAKDIKVNYKGTGRTMVAFHITYSGADPAVYTNGKWVEGWGVTFRAYYDWKDMDTVNKVANANLAAFMPDFGKGYIDDTNRGYPRLYGLATQVYNDNGEIDDLAKSRIYADLIGGGGKIDDLWIDAADRNADGTCKYDKEIIVDKDTNATTEKWNRNVLYAETTVNDNVATSSQSTLQKLVRADQDQDGADVDQYGGFRESAVAAEGGTYTYELTVSAELDSPVKEIAVFDRLEAASPEDERPWTPQFLGVDLEALEKQSTDVNAPKTEEPADTDASETQKVPVTVYYNDRSDAPIAEEDQKDVDPRTILTAKNGWYTKDEDGEDTAWKSNVRAVAVLFDADYELQGGHSVSFRIQMKAPGSASGLKDKYAYNEAAFSSVSINNNNTRGVVTCKPARVGVSKMERLEIVKRTSGVVPTAFKDTEFEFKVYEAGEKKADDRKLAFLSYELYRADKNGKWDEEPDGQPHATDENGRLYLKANEKAVFHVADPDRITVEESTNIFWESNPDVSNPTRGGKPVEERYTETVAETEDEATGETITRTVTRTQDPAGDIHVRTWTNTFRPVLYVQKELIAGPETVDDTFTFQLKVKKNGTYVEAANTPYWYVDSVRTDGGLPGRVDKDGQPWPDADGNASQAPHKTDMNGKFTIKQGQIIALFPGTAGTQYELAEAGLDENGYTGDWYCEEPTVTDGTLKAMGSEETITNYYRWKDLNLAKEITHQDAAECKQGFSFQIVELKLDANGQPELDEDENVIPLKKDGKMTTAGLKWELVDADDDTPGPKSGELTENGELFDCYCAGKTIRVHGLDACKYYMVKELPVAADEEEKVVLYQPVKDSEQFKILPAATAQDVTITNDYLKRPLTVKKTVTGEKKGEGEMGFTEPEFTFTVTVNGAPLPSDTAYTVTKQGTVIASGEVDESGNFVQKIGEEIVTEENAYRLLDGKFKLHDGESITFENAGILGQAFEITEDKSEYTQLFPAAKADAGTQPGEDTENVPATGTLLGEGGEASFVNGTPDALYISKEYVTEETDETKPAVKLKACWEDEVEELVDDISMWEWETGEGFSGFSSEYSAEFMLEVTAEGEAPYLWPKESTWVTGTNQRNGETVKLWWKGGESIFLPPWIILSIPVGTEEGEIPPTASYTLTEAESSQKRIIEVRFGDDTADDDIGVDMDTDMGMATGISSQVFKSASRILKDENLRANLGSVSRPDRPDSSQSVYVQITQKYPADGGSISGVVEEAPVATIVNELKSLDMFNGSRIGKRMTGASHTVPTGQKLVWRLEKYVGEIPAGNGSDENWYDEKNWKPAEGIRYAVFKDNGIPISGEVMTTGSGGRIELEKPEGGYPEVRFVNSQVYIDLYDPARVKYVYNAIALIGDEELRQPLLRLVEVPEESGKEWGLLAGYEGGGKYSWNLYERGMPPSGYPINFVNSNSKSSIKIEKYTARPTRQEFKMILKQVLGTTDDATSVNNIDSTNYGKLVSEPRDGIEYTIHNVDGSTVEGRTRDVTKSGGEITLRSGQYVTLEVPEGTVWTVEEDGYVSQNYKLTGLEDTAASGRTKRLALDTAEDPTENLMLINIPAPLTRYTLRFDANGGTGGPAAIAKESAAGSVEFTIPEDEPTREHYKFDSWICYMGRNNEITYHAGDTVSMSSDMTTLTLKACWAETYTLIYHPGEGVDPEEVTNLPGTETQTTQDIFTIPQTPPERKGYIFTGWKLDDNTTYKPGDKVSVAHGEPKTLYAVWKIEQRSVTYDANGGKFEDGSSLRTDKTGIEFYYEKWTYTIKKKFEDSLLKREGLAFKGWSENPNPSEGDTIYERGDDIYFDEQQAKITLYAVWK